jgi:hypothetical protein
VKILILDPNDYHKWAAQILDRHAVTADVNGDADLTLLHALHLDDYGRGELPGRIVVLAHQAIDDALLLRARAVGAVGVAPKPWTPDRLRRLVEKGEGIIRC